MTGLISPAVRAARKVAAAAVESPASAYGVVDAIVFELDSAQLLQSPERAAELARLRARVAELETTAGLVAEYRVPLVDEAWLVVRREPCGDRWAILGSHLRGGRRPVYVGGRWTTLPVVGPDGAWVYESARAALDTAVQLAAEGGAS